jgi:hypothetical protein
MNSEAGKLHLRRHPLQRLESPSKGFSGALHVSGFFGYADAIGADVNP